MALPLACALAHSAGAQAPDLLPAPAASGDSVRSAEELWVELRANHPWAQFEPGAWRKTRTTSEVFNEFGRVASRTLTERTERLVAVDEHTYEIAVDTVVELAGRRTPGATVQRRLSIATDQPIALGEPEITPQEIGSISLGQVMAPCRVWRIEQPVPGGIQVDTLWVAEEGFPSILRLERHATIEETSASRRVQSVAAIGAPVAYGSFLVDGWRVETTLSTPSGERSESQAVHSAEIPGGIQHASVVEYDPEGHRVRWSVTQLVGSGRTPQEALGAESEDSEPTIAIEVRPRRLLRLLRGEQPEEEEDAPQP